MTYLSVLILNSFCFHRQDLDVSRGSAKRWLRRIRQLHRTEETSSKPLVFISTVNGYHQFRATPPTGINFPMTIEPETNNPYDRFACLVKAPAQDHLQGRYLEFSGVTFGRVPKNICNVISVDKRKQILLRARCVFLGHMVHDGQQRGGGPKLVCMYLLEYRNNVNIHEVGNHLRRYVNEDFIFM
ncbi:uncharacterized protein LOC128162503 [Crassostrea angulata]|uniref:uncharacterized protein LOC128162502 n=1 Tax=Magallana angulata TaxID=2784310 RepID=UPI0022B1916B|nr:uncharacterized protein LOC128162502 [Crassostrea angulata]XP_052681697.1 uncharacterized protein LOC128162503 [Crassostrea angulata]